MKTGVLFIHGFTGGSFEVRPFVNYLHSKTDWRIDIPILPGHDTSLNLGKASADSWLMVAEQALKKLQKEVDHVMVVGFSMGGLIALYLALRYKIDKLVLLSPAVKYISPRNLIGEIGSICMGTISKKATLNTFHHLYEYKLMHTPLHAVIEFLRIVKMVEPYFHRITTPICIVQGKKDEIVPFSSAEYLFERIGSEKKEFIKSELGKHHICYSDDSDSWFHEAFLFMNQNTWK